MMLEERRKKATPEPAARDIDPLAVLVDVSPRFQPVSAATQIDEVGVLKKKLVAPMTGQQHSRAKPANGREVCVSTAPLSVEKWCFGVPDGLAAAIHDAGGQVVHARDLEVVRVLNLYKESLLI
jgi:hypothetical protein